MDQFMAVIKKYTVFSGRARRREYWMFTLVYFIISIVLSIVDGIAHLQLGTPPVQVGILSTALGLGLLLPSFGVLFRRLHDTNRSGWWWLIVLIPLVGVILLIVWLATEGQPGENKYGRNPKEA